MNSQNGNKLYASQHNSIVNPRITSAGKISLSIVFCEKVSKIYTHIY